MFMIQSKWGNSFNHMAFPWKKALIMLIWSSSTLATIREKAAEKVYSELGRIRNIKESSGRDMMIAVAGCVAQAEGKEIFKRAPFVDIVVGPQSYQNLPELIEQVKRNKKWAIDLDFPKESKFDSLQSTEDKSQGVSAFFISPRGL